MIDNSEASGCFLVWTETACLVWQRKWLASWWPESISWEEEGPGSQFLFHGHVLQTVTKPWECRSQLKQLVLRPLHITLTPVNIKPALFTFYNQKFEKSGVQDSQLSTPRWFRVKIKDKYSLNTSAYLIKYIFNWCIQKCWFSTKPVSCFYIVYWENRNICPTKCLSVLHLHHEPAQFKSMALVRQR